MALGVSCARVDAQRNAAAWEREAQNVTIEKKNDYPAYVERGGENPRGIHAILLLEKKKDFTLDSLIACAYDSYLPAFQDQIPALMKAWAATASTNPLKAKLADPIASLRA